MWLLCKINILDFKDFQKFLLIYLWCYEKLKGGLKMLGKKKNNKKYFVTILGVIVIIVFSVQFVYASEYTIKIGGVWGPDAILCKGHYLFKDIIERTSEGKIEVEIYPSEQLGSQTEITDSVKMGAIEMAWCDVNKVNNKFTIIGMPFLFESMEKARSALNSPVIKKFKEEAEQNGYHVIGMIIQPPRNITNNVRPIEKPDDLKGLLLRVPPRDLYRKSMEYLGASPQSISLGETYMALKTGVVDGQENPSMNIKDVKFYEVQKYLSLVKYTIYPGTYCLNADFYESLPDKYKKLVDSAAQTTVDYIMWYYETELEECEQFLREKMIINEITPENHKLFVEKLKPLWQEYINNGVFSKEELDQILAYSEG